MYIFLSVYILSVIGAWLYIHGAFSKGGKWDGGEPDIIDFLIMLLPVTNIVLTVDFFLGKYKLNYNRFKFFNKFFGVK